MPSRNSSFSFSVFGALRRPGEGLRDLVGRGAEILLRNRGIALGSVHQALIEVGADLAGGSHRGNDLPRLPNRGIRGIRRGDRYGLEDRR